MAKKNYQLEVGAFVLFALLVLMGVLLILGGQKRAFDKQYALIAYFEDISGLRVGAPVQLSGLQVGNVSDISFEHSLENKKVRVKMLVLERFRERIREDSTANVVSQGLLGDKMMFLTPGSADKRMLNNGDIVNSSAVSGFTQLMNRGDELVQNVNQLVTEVHGVVKDVRQQKGVAHSLIYDPRGDQLMKNLTSMSESLKNMSEEVNQITKKVNAGEGTLGALINDPSLYNDMKTLLGKANRNAIVRAAVRATLSTKDENLTQK